MTLRESFHSFRQLLSGLTASRDGASLFETLTPPPVRERPPLVRLLYAGGVATALGVSLLGATTAAMLLVLALGVIYYLLSQLLGIKLELDPSGFVPGMQRPSGNSAPN